MTFKNFKKRAITSTLLLFLVVLIFEINLFFVYSIIVLSVLSIIEFLNLTKNFIVKKFNFITINLLFFIYIIFFCITLIFFYGHYQLKIILFSLLLCCAASDVGGYLFGNFFKGPKLTKISPNKTVSGAIGSLITSVIFLVSIFNMASINITLKTFIIAISTSLSCQAGDLFFSYLKRKAKIKDTGKFLPGHGGILDRIDGILIGVPVGILIIIYF